MKQRILVTLVCIGLFVGLVATTALADGAVASYTDGSGTTVETNDFILAVSEVADGGTITLLADVTLNQELEFSNKTVTLLGNGYTITITSGEISLDQESVLCLGSPGYDKSLTIRSESRTQAILDLHDNAQMLMYDGVTLGPSSGMARPGGVHLSDSSKFTMYGGKITECTNLFSVSGAVSITDNSTFHMIDGLIEDCYGVEGGAIGLHPGPAIGAVSSGTASFIMEGGTIRNCTDGYYGGGAIFAGSVTGNENKPFILSITGGTIENCSADSSEGRGGAIAIVTESNFGSEISISGLTLSGNNAKGAGGAIYIDAPNISKIQLKDIKALGNTAGTSGGGVYLERGNLTCTNLTLSGNTASTGNGGGIYLYSIGGKSVSLEGDIRATGNRADSGSGGGIYVQRGNAGGFSLSDNSLIQQNTAASGGGIAVDNQTLSPFNLMGEPEIYDNAASFQGDDIFFTGEGALMLPDVPAGSELSCGHTVDNWYYDDSSDRWGTGNCGRSDKAVNPLDLDAFILNAPVALKAAHDEIQQHTISASAGPGGSISPEGEVTVEDGGSQEFIITAEEGYEIQEILVDGTSIGVAGGATDSYTFNNVITSHAIEAIFKKITYTLTYSANYGTPAETKDGGTHAANESVTLLGADAFTREGYQLVGWNDAADGSGAAYALGAVFTMPAGVVVLYAQWERQYQITYDANGGDPASVPVDDSWYSPGNTVAVSSEQPTWEGHTFIGWKYGDTVYQEGGTFTMPAENVTLYAQWERQYVTIRPADVTIYMGGKDGYEGAVDSENEIVATDSLPVPGFLVTLPEDLIGVDVTELILQYQEDDILLQWQFAKYGGGNHSIYRIDPMEDTDTRPVRMVFTNAAGETVTDDQFVITDHLDQKLAMEVYGEGIRAGEVFVAYGGVSYPIITGNDPAILTVRGTTDQVEYGGIYAEATRVPEGASGVTVPAGTTYTINGGPVQVDDTSGIALLFDDIIENNNVAGTSNTDLLTQRAEEVLAEMDDTGLSGRWNRRYEAKYLDLVDTNNGNAWVAASQDITVYWPLPEGTDWRTDFVLLHFEELHREMATSDLPGQIDNCTVTAVDIQVTRDHITFTVDSGGFSPFLLVWEEKPDSKPPRPGDDDEIAAPDELPELNTEDHYAYIVGYEDGTVRPEGFLTRAEVATIFFRLLTDTSRERFWTTWSGYSDVTWEAWYNNAIATMTNAGILKGYENSTFRPNANITRAEFAAIAARFDDSVTEIDSGFADIEGHWAEMEICRAVSLGWIQGYEDGTFRPDQPITRAEVMTIVNRMLDRVPEDETDLLPDMNAWSDNLPGTWYYLAVQEATNSHTYIRKDGGYETWIAMLEDPDWTQYQ